jgi:hypothetical protein
VKAVVVLATTLFASFVLKGCKHTDESASCLSGQEFARRGEFVMAIADIIPAFHFKSSHL